MNAPTPNPEALTQDDVQLLTDTAALLADLERWIDRELPVHERPKALRLGPSLPVGESGKPADWDLDDAVAIQRHW